MNPELLRDKQLFVLDLDGTFYLSHKLLPGALDFIERLRRKGARYLFFTNNSSRPKTWYVDLLHELGVPADEANIHTSAQVMKDYLRTHYAGKRLYLSANAPVVDDFRHDGFVVDYDNPDVIVLCFDMELTYARLCDICALIRKGVPFLCTHPDVNCPTEHGPIPDCGAMIELIAASTGVRPKITGKPFPETVDSIIRTTGIAKADMCFVGDRLETDIAMGVNSGVTSALVLTGATTADMAAQSAIKPDLTFAGIHEMVQYV